MAAHYDDYDYPSYWDSREYEHKAEALSLRKLLSYIPTIGTLLDVGAGYGRLTPTYLHRAKKIILTDPSQSLLKIAKHTLQEKKITYIKSKAETLPGKIRKNSVDAIVCVRVAHHIEDLNKPLKVFHSLLTKNGYLIFEFANKRHLKALLTEFGHGNFTFALDIFPKDVRSAKNKKECTLPFINYHPDIVKQLMKENGFVIKEVMSVSNIRSPFLKRFFSTEVLLSLETLFQPLFSRFSIGPSIFILAQKKNK